MAPNAKIEVWLDCNSYYSRFALQHLRRYARQLAENGVEYEVYPVFINGINAGSNNQPPWMNPVKGRYTGKFDGPRAAKYFGNTKPMIAPKEFPLKTLMALRSMCFVKEKFGREKFETAFLELWVAIWEEQIDIGQAEKLAGVYARHFSEQQVRDIMAAAGDARFKTRLSENTDAALKRGAYGAPWFWVRNARGDEEPFFGSDRFHYMWDYLDIPHKDFEVIGKASKL